MPQYVLKPIRLISKRTLVPKDFFKLGDSDGYFTFDTTSANQDVSKLLVICKEDIVITPPLTMSKVREGALNGWIQTDCIIEIDCTEQQIKDYIQKGKIPAYKILAIHQKTKSETKVYRRGEILVDEIPIVEFLKIVLPKKPNELNTVLTPELESLGYPQLKDLLLQFNTVQSSNNQLFNKPVPEAIQQLYNSLERSTWDAMVNIFQQAVKNELGSLSSKIPKFDSSHSSFGSSAPS